MGEFFQANWQIILQVVMFVGIVVALVILYHKNKVSMEYIEAVDHYLDTIDDGDGLVSVLAQYARHAVRAVEQLVKAGLIPKEDTARKDAAVEIVEQCAIADGVKVSDVPDDVINNLVESAVYVMKVEEQKVSEAE